jgi:phosphotransferase system HPr (HPr) family protein
MSQGPLRGTFQITNPQGFHLRPKAAFVEAASKFKSDVTVGWRDQSANGKSILELMLLPAEQGHTITVEVDGPDAPQALEALLAVLAAPPPPEEGDPDAAPSPDRPEPDADGGPLAAG